MNVSSLQKRLVYFLFALSGCIALVYEILWTKYLSLTFGTTIEAVSVVTATFMAGLAIGSLLLGRYADRSRRLLLVYALLEVGIGLSALLFPLALDLLEQVYIWLRQTLPDHSVLTTALHLGFAALLLLPASICMGGTLPVMCRFFVKKQLTSEIGRLYALNTLGATLGAFGSGFLLIPLLGLSRTGWLAVVVNLLIALGVWRLGLRVCRLPPADQVAVPERPRIRTKGYGFLLLSVMLVGGYGLAYEILWTRVLLLFLGNTSYAFATMLSAYLVGIALGGAIYARQIRLRTNVTSVFAYLTVGMGISVALSVPFYDRLAYVFLWAHDLAGERWWFLSLCYFVIVFGIMCIPTTVSGSLLPAAVAILAPEPEQTGWGVGTIVLHNTVGAVLGSLAAGFVLIPLLGIQGSFRLLAALNILTGLVLYICYGGWCHSRIVLPLLAMAGLGSVAWPAAWNPALMNSGVYCYAEKYLEMGGLDKILGDEKIIDVIEGTDTTVAIHESLDGHLRFFTVNGKTDGGTGRDMGTQILISQIPLLLHRNPEDVLVIGLGTGISLRGMSAHPTRSIDCVEISPEVVRASSYFTEASGNVLDDPKVRLLVEDGRNLLLTTEKYYDLIISEPSNPWQTGNANLFTLDFYRLAARRLAADGVFCQWVGLYDITTENLKVASNTFLQVFPHVLVFKSGADLIMVGSRKPLVMDYQLLGERLAVPEITKTLQLAGIATPGDLLANHYLFAENTLRKFCAGASLNTDDQPILEFSARYNLGRNTLGRFQRENMAALTGVIDKVFLPVDNLGRSRIEVARALRDIGSGYEKAGRRGEAAHFLKLARDLEVGVGTGG
jgi:spermidine synthase